MPLYCCLTMASGIFPLQARLAKGIATTICQIMDLPPNDPVRNALQHARDGHLGKRLEAGLQNAASIAGVGNPLHEQRRSARATTYNDERAAVAKTCVAYAMTKISTKLLNERAPHIQECMDIHIAKKTATRRDAAGNHTGRPYTATSLIGQSYTKGNKFGRELYRQITAAGTDRNDYTRKGPHDCNTRCDDCGCDRDTNRHWVVHCPKHASARTRFTAKTGITITDHNYIQIMALDAVKLGTSPECLSTALFHLLASTARRNTNTASVAPTRSNQGAHGHCR